MRPEPNAGFFLMNDNTGGGGVDPSVSPYDAYGPFGAWSTWNWSQLNPGNGAYDWSPGGSGLLEAYLAGAATYGKPVALSVFVMNTAGSDYTPSWVYALDLAAGGTGTGWPILPAATGHFPKWSATAYNKTWAQSSIWNSAWAKFIEAFGNRWNGDPRIHSIWIVSGVSGEAIFDGLGTDTKSPITNFCKPTIDLMNTHFPHPAATGQYNAGNPGTPLFYIGGTESRREMIAYAAARDVNYKQNVLGADLSSHTINPVGWGVAQSGSAECGYYTTVGWPDQNTSPLGKWLAMEHGDIESDPKDMYCALLAGIAWGMRCFDTDNVASPGSELMQQIADIDTDALLGDFWTVALRLMGHDRDQLAMWIGRDTGYQPWAVGTSEAAIDAAIAAGSTLWKKTDAWVIVDASTDPDTYAANTWDAGWVGPWIRNGITVNATGHSIVSATYAGAPAALKNVCYSDAGIGYCADANLTIAVTGLPPGTYDTTVIYSVTGAGAAWAVDTDTLTVAQDGTGSLTSVAGPCWVHLVLVEPDTVSPSNLPPNAPSSPQCESATNPVNVTDLTPEFSWVFSDPNSGDAQSAYQIIVAQSPIIIAAGVGTMWDSGKVVSADHSGISYNNDSGGYALAYGTTYYWSVRTWDDADATGAWCAVQQFTVYDPTPPVVQIAPIVLWPQCEGQTNPTEVNTLTPDFSWTFYDANGDLQSRYRIIVASTAALLDAGTGDLWASEVASAAASGITYAGTGLAWDTTYYWKARVWDDSDGVLGGSYCARQQFTTKNVVTPEPSDEPGLAVREHFRAGSGRVLEWLGSTFTRSGMRATTPADPTQPGVCLIKSISMQEDASEMVTRLYPQTAEGLTLALATRVAPEGYEISTMGKYVRHKTAEDDYGIIEAWMRFDDVSMQQNDSYVVHPELAANALADRAIEYLRTRCQPNYYYTIDVFSNQPIRVGETIRVVYHGYSDTGSYISVDDDLYIMAVTTRVDNAGLRTMTLEVSTIDVLRKSDEEVLARAIRAARRAPRVKNT
jgi:hypothetical protein